MNRPIEFRAWCKREDKMVFDFRYLGSDMDITKTIGSDFHLMQFTGLKDKNGKKIFW